MRFWRRHPGIRAVLALLLALQAGCSTWRVQPVAPAEVLAEQPHKRVRLTLVDGGRVEIHCPRLVSDSVIGVRSDTTGCRAVAPAAARESVAVALSQVDSVALRKPSAGRSIGLFFGVILGVLVVFAAVCAATDCLTYSTPVLGTSPGN